MIRINSEIDQSINSITIDPLCTDYVDENNNVCNVPSTIFTIVSSNDDGDGGVTVESSPANLVTATTWRNTLAFEWNHTVASTAKSSGSSSVRIGIPSDQLLSVSVMNGQTAQLVEGFTNITYLVLTGADSVLRASMTTSISTELELDNDGGWMYIETNIPVTDGYVSDGGQSWVQTPSFVGFFINDNGTQLNIKGDIDDSTSGGRVSDGAQLTVTGIFVSTCINPP